MDSQGHAGDHEMTHPQGDLMAEQRWTRNAPTQEGWYWMRAPKHGWRDCVMWVDQDDDGFYIDVGDCDSEYVTEIDAEWQGPLTPHEATA